MAKDNTKFKMNLKMNWPLYAMLIPGIIVVFIFSYIPMYGLVIAFQDYQPTQGFTGSPFVKGYWFNFIFNMPDFWQIVKNTVSIAVAKIIFGQLASIAFALMLNEVINVRFKRTVQTMVYLPYFLSWVILGSIFVDILSVDGIVNRFIALLGGEPIFFLGSNKWFRFAVVSTSIWQSFGWGTILYLAALTGIDPSLYEAAAIDGAGRWRQTWHITLPGIMPTIILLATLSLGSVLNAGFEQLLVMYNPAVYETGDILDTFIYRTGLKQAQFSLATAVGLIKSIAGFIMISISYYLANRFANYRIF